MMINDWKKLIAVAHSEVVSGCSHDCSHDDTHEEEANLVIYGIRLIVTIILTAVAVFVKLPATLTLALFILAYGLVSYDIIIKAIKNLLKGQLFDENFLMAIASLGAFAIGERTEAIAVLVFYGVGELLQELAVERSRKNIVELMDIRPDTANLKVGSDVKEVSPEEVQVGDIIIVKPGEKIPLDGVVIKGTSYVDSAALTGESLPRKVTADTAVLSGSVNGDGLLEIEVAKPYQESTVAKILDLVEHAGDKKADSEKLITKFARIYTPVVVLISLLVIILPPLFKMGTFNEWLYRGLSFLIISCPCALVISIPLSFFGGIGGAAYQGILLKGANYLESLKDLDTVVFDKTGTLTEGSFEVREILPAQGVTVAELLKMAAIAESQSTHPIALSIVKAYGQEIKELVEVSEKAGLGLTVKTKEGTISVGNGKLMKELGINQLPGSQGTITYIAKEKQYQGCIVLGDQKKKGIKEALAAIKAVGVKKLMLLSGDRQEIVVDLANELGIDEFHYELLPQDKVSIMEEVIRHKQGVTAFVGDGINDAPVLKRADIGIAMGGIGSDAAIEAADVVIMNDDISKIATAVKIAKKTSKIVWQNISLALIVKAVIMILAFLGITSIWLAIFADVGVALLALFNAVRVLKV